MEQPLQGSDYQSTSGSLTFNPGDVSKTITVPVNGDVTNEANETFFVNLSNFRKCQHLGQPGCRHNT